MPFPLFALATSTPRQGSTLSELASVSGVGGYVIVPPGTRAAPKRLPGAEGDRRRHQAIIPRRCSLVPVDLKLTDLPRPRPAIAERQLRTQRHKTKSSGRFSQGGASSGHFLTHIPLRSYDLGVCTARRSSCTHLACRLAQAQGKRTL